ncbi:hypothetical protein C922_05267 [Plasmodium inui San Antonio 1]|uniref:Uncharacterized protein n=1 Tax=Plasmodium inui San Antonio 1 TaxID=1237626 RepID=W6ZYC8_9APIC|nr:hypothetical protein C922_05267 [Plasmodium inui San Antonio 1]EUD64348.1 hypothetical protein C922_05267 [Plasmodium inui San Antonio 1]
MSNSPRFSDWIRRRIWEKRGNEASREESLTQLKLHDLVPEQQGRADQISRDRWNNLESRGEISMKGIEVRARLLCQAIEVWVNNLPQEEDGIWQEAGADCLKKQTGFLFGGAARDSCKINTNNNNWSTLSARRQLYRNQDYQRDLAVCMDMMSIILVLYQNITPTVKGWRIEGKDACTAMYDELRSWGGPGVAQEIMKEWFYNKTEGELPPSGLPIRTAGTSTSGMWGDFIKAAQSYIVQLQCYQTSGESDHKWETTCVQTKNETNCEKKENDQQAITNYKKSRSIPKASQSRMLNKESNPYRQIKTRVRIQALTQHTKEADQNITQMITADERRDSPQPPEAGVIQGISQIKDTSKTPGLVEGSLINKDRKPERKPQHVKTLSNICFSRCLKGMNHGAHGVVYDDEVLPKRANLKWRDKYNSHTDPSRVSRSSQRS